VKILAFDYGTKRIGVAVSDPDGRFAMAGKPIENFADAVEAIAERIDAESPDRVVVGLPIRLDGTEGGAARRVRDVIAEVAARTGVPIEPFDERLTSEEARLKLRGVELSRARKKSVVNTLSAQIILQAYLDSMRAGGYNSSR
jgi:putative Holliday junction resolvase